ncbi:MAG: hypothetical protein WCT28_00370 [Patescibacteria group bacterium]|jgi:hypothetical protein
MRRIIFKNVIFFFAIFIAFFPCKLFAATVIDFTDQPTSMQASMGSNHKFVFTTVTNIPEGSSVLFTFPVGFDLAAITEDDVDIADDYIQLTTASDCLASDNVSVTVTGQNLSLGICAGDGGSIATGSVVTIEVGTNAHTFGSGINRITNPSVVNSYFIKLKEGESGLIGNHGSLILEITSTGGPTVGATVPTQLSPGGGGGDRPDGGYVPFPEEESDEGPEVPVVPVVPEVPIDEEPVAEIPVVPEVPGYPPDNFYEESPSDNSEGSAYVPDVLQDFLEDVGNEVIDVVKEEGTEVLPVLPIEEPIFESEEPELSLPPIVESVTVEEVQEDRVLLDIRTAVVDVAVPLGLAAAVATIAILATSFNLFSYLQFLFTSPFLFISRRRRRAFGIVYNAVTKVPVDLAIVRLYNIATGRLLNSMVTGVDGKYFFVASPGQYRVAVTRNGFIFPSTYLTGVKDDGVFLDVYTGQIVEVTDRDATIAANIPLDVAQDQKIQEPKYIFRRRLLRRLQFVFSLSGSFLSIVACFLSPSLFTIGLVVLQVIVFILFWRLARPKKPRGWGVVYDVKTRRPVGNAIIRLFEPKYNKLVESTISDALGRYSFIVGPNEYFVTTNKAGYEERTVRPIDYRQKREPEPMVVDVPLERKKPV